MRCYPCLLTEYESCPDDVSFGSALSTGRARPSLGMASRPRACVVFEIMIFVFMLNLPLNAIVYYVSHKRSCEDVLFEGSKLAGREVSD